MACSERRVAALPGEGGQVGGEHGVEQAGVLYAGGADDLAKLEAAEAGGDDVVRRHSRNSAQVHALAGVELGGDDAGATDLEEEAAGRACPMPDVAPVTRASLVMSDCPLSARSGPARGVV